MKASSEQKFCRACGFGLDKVAELIAEQAPPASDRSNEANGDFPDDRLRKLEKWAVRALYALGGVLGSLMLGAIIFKVMIEKGRIFQGSILLMILAGIGLVSFLAYLDSARKKLALSRRNQHQRLTQAQETAKMLSESKLEMAPSVTEQTTASLEERIESRR
ncbi:MAG TPA: hypothetical protein VJ810_16740 [Blastocatellia bacterium]|nr:hypothetical protein [Blastocatellia bacterium]